MTERINSTPERRIEAPEQLPELPPEAGTEYGELPHEQLEQLEASARQAAAEAAGTSEQPELPAADDTPQAAPYLVTKESRQATTYLALKHLRRRLPATERALSRIVHQPAIQAISEVSGKSVSRPSGLLGGGICAFIGSLVYLYLTKHIGFTYNYLLFILFFAGGFVAGLIVELLFFVLRRKHQA